MRKLESEPQHSVQKNRLGKVNSDKSLKETKVSVSSVFRAMEEEDRKIENIRMKNMTKSNEERQVKGKDKKIQKYKMSNDAEYHTIIERVLDMDPFKQKKLLQALEEIESGFKTPRDIVKPGSLRKTLSLRIISNWGDFRVGLTAVEFYGDNEKIPIADITVKRARDQSGNIGNLIDGKTKTVKDKHMWSCLMSDDEETNPEINIVCDEVPNKMKIWNYNRSLAEISTGVKELEVVHDGQILFKGCLEKGCGNHIFEYGQTLALSNPSSTPTVDKVSMFEPDEEEHPRSETRILNKAPGEEIPVIDNDGKKLKGKKKKSVAAMIKDRKSKMNVDESKTNASFKDENKETTEINAISDVSLTPR